MPEISRFFGIVIKMFFDENCEMKNVGKISNRLLKNSPGESLRAKRSNPIHKKIKYFEIATSLRLLAMTGRIEFFRNLLRYSLPYFAVEVDVPVIHEDIERGAQGMDIWALRRLFAVEGLDGDASYWLKLSGEQMAQGGQVLGQMWIIGWNMERKILAVPPRHGHQLGSPVDEVGAGNPRRQHSPEGVQLNSA